MCVWYIRFSLKLWLVAVLIINLRSSPPADESVHVADAGSGLPALRSPCGRHPQKPSLSHHPIHSTTGEASGWDGAYTQQCVTVKHTHSYKYRASTDGLWPIGTRFESVWCHRSGTFLCGTRLDLTRHHGLVTHMGVAKTQFHSFMEKHKQTNWKSAYAHIVTVGCRFTCACTQSCKGELFTLFKCQV